MYNLFRFIVRYYLLLLFLLLEFFCFYLIYRNSRFHQAAYSNTGNALSGRVYSTSQNVASYFYLRSISDSLVKENASLRARLQESLYDTRVDTGSVSDSSARRYVQSYSYIAAKVIRNSIVEPTNILYLDKGSAQGITKQMGVISPTGIVGQVVNVTEHYSAVMSVLSKDFKVSARFKKNDYFGYLRWDGIFPDEAILEDVPKHAPVKVGDTVVTSGYSQLFPRNVMIGVVKKVHAEPEKGFLDVSVRLTSDFGNLNYVYVVNNIRKEEMQQLDSVINPPKAH
ncbi:MAG: rod shape-determining protein MreC [Bacteroidetes bacterium]|nr:rod shape-determining protein MreC [Bacteroidota bacterium]